jgi:hypothetical protein
MLLGAEFGSDHECLMASKKVILMCMKKSSHELKFDTDTVIEIAHQRRTLKEETAPKEDIDKMNSKFQKGTSRRKKIWYACEET